MTTANSGHINWYQSGQFPDDRRHLKGLATNNLEFDEELPFHIREFHDGIIMKHNTIKSQDSIIYNKCEEMNHIFAYYNKTEEYLAQMKESSVI